MFISKNEKSNVKFVTKIVYKMVARKRVEYF